MVNQTSSVRFNNDEPIIFYYESLEDEIEEESFYGSNSNLHAKKGFKTNFLFRAKNKFKDSMGELEKTNQKNKEIKKDLTPTNKEQKKQAEYKEHLETKYVNRIVDDVSDTNWNEVELYSNMSTAETEIDYDPDYEKNVITPEEASNATYFYNVLHKLIDVMCEGSRFKCLQISERPCESCKVVEELIMTLFDVPTLEDVILERSNRGTCGYLFCLKPSNKSKSKSKYKIDILSRNIYKRKEYESFCSVKCLEKNEKLTLKVMSSPVDEGTFTPEDMRSADNESLRKLHEGVLLMPECLAIPTRELLNLCENTIKSLYMVVKRKNDGKERQVKKELKTKIDLKSAKKTSKTDKTKMFEIYERFDSFSCLSETSLPVMKVNSMFKKQLQNKMIKEDKKESKRLESIDSESREDLKAELQQIPEEKEQKEKEEQEDSKGQEQLGSFSMLWYLLSNMVTKDTKQFVNQGLVKKLQFYEQFEPLYVYCLKDVPQILIPTLNVHVHYILSTFKTVKSKMFNNKSIKPLSYIIKYILLINRHHLPINYPELKDLDKSNSEEGKLRSYLKIDKNRKRSFLEDYNKVTDEEKEENYQKMMRDVDGVLYSVYKLNQEHIDILLELFLEE